MTFDAEQFKENLTARLRRQYGKDISQANKHDLFDAVSASALEIIMPNWMETRKAYEAKPTKQLCYLSAEFLMGRALSNNLINSGIMDQVKEVLKGMNINYDLVEDEEPDAGLGNGGLGRLAACFLDSLATLEYPGHGYGIRYQYGMFEQHIEDGYQVEYPDNWLKHRDPWETKRSDLAVTVKFGGQIKYGKTPDGQDRFYLENAEEIIATPYDMPIVAYGSNTVNTLRLWQASSPNGFDLQLFNDMQYHRAVERQNDAENISRVLYPNDNGPMGKELRLRQQYFFSSASLQDLVHHYVNTVGTDFSKFHEYHVIQLNDTHPVVAIPELMRILLDEYNVGWDDAWNVVTKTFAYTNHTILAEALEKWPLKYLEKAVPQLVPIIKELDKRVRAKYKDPKVQIIDENDRVHMAHIDIHYGISVNGVAALHTEILKESELKAFYDIYPEKFNNKTNGITFRRWLMSCNRELASYITTLIGDGWKKDADKLEDLMKYIDDEVALAGINEIKQEKKAALAEYIKEKEGVEINPESIYDIQIKRLHEYKRQQMNALYIIHKYLEIKSGKKPVRPLTFIFGAKAAPAYVIAQDIIHLILCLQEIVSNDKDVAPYMKVVMVENYNVSYAEKLIPACDISEQISLASKEASGTGNMKFMLNGAVTLGTMDGANVEIHDLVGDENIYTFGKDSDTVIKHYEDADYVSKEYYENSEVIKEAVDFIISDECLKVGHKENLERLYKELINKDWFMTLLDLEEYIEVKDKAFAEYEDRAAWEKKMLVNIAKAGFFSSDRTIAQYNEDIWHLS